MRNKRNHGGILEGLQEGGLCLVDGISSGVTGLVNKPLVGGRKGGVLGFFGGLGSGLVGTVVKPVVGISTGVASIATGISQQISIEEKNKLHFRPPRVFIRSDIDPNDYVLRDMDISAAYIQAFVHNRSEGGTGKVA